MSPHGFLKGTRVRVKADGENGEVGVVSLLHPDGSYWVNFPSRAEPVELREEEMVKVRPGK